MIFLNLNVGGPGRTSTSIRLDIDLCPWSVWGWGTYYRGTIRGFTVLTAWISITNRFTTINLNCHSPTWFSCTSMPFTCIIIVIVGHYHLKTCIYCPLCLSTYFSIKFVAQFANHFPAPTTVWYLSCVLATSLPSLQSSSSQVVNL